MNDLDGEKRLVALRSGKGDKDRNTLQPHSLLEPLQHQLRQVRKIHQADLVAGWGRVQLPRALARKYPNAGREWGWQWVFPQHHRWRDAQSRQEGRHNLEPTLIQKAERRAVLAAGINKPAGCHSFRHSQWLRHACLRPGKATHLLERSQDIRTIQELLGHSDVRTMMIINHVLNCGSLGVASPAEPL